MMSDDRNHRDRQTTEEHGAYETRWNSGGIEELERGDGEV